MIGKVVQVDTMTVTPYYGFRFKQFTAVDVASRYLVGALYSRATAACAARCTEMAADLEGARRQWAEWEDTYNRVRPHQSLGLKTPIQYIRSRSSSRACSQMS